VSLHIPWDRVNDFAKLAAHAADLGVRIGAVNSNLFQDDDFMLGSLTHPDSGVRAKAVAHHVECVEIMRQTGSTDLKLWLPDGLNYPGQDGLRDRQERLADSLRHWRRWTPITGSRWSTSSSRTSTPWTSPTGAHPVALFALSGIWPMSS
jgi:L-rhamnose isomerase